MIRDEDRSVLYVYASLFVLYLFIKFLCYSSGWICENPLTTYLIVVAVTVFACAIVIIIISRKDKAKEYDNDYYVDDYYVDDD